MRIPSISVLMTSRFAIAVALLSLMALVTLNYQPALNGPFVFDDQVNILENPAVKLQDLTWQSLKQSALSNESGLFKRILPALSFGLNYYQAQGFERTYVFKITSIGIHVINAWLVFSLMLQLAPKLFKASITAQQTGLLAFFMALLWAIHPLQVSTVAYIVQRMTSMATLFMLLGLNGIVWARNRLAQGKRFALPWALFALVAGTVLGLLCKENAVLLVLYAAVIEFCLYTREGHEKIMRPVYGVLLGVPLLIALYLLITDKLNILAGYYARPFTLEQRLLTEVRVLWLYVQMLVIPDIRVMGLFHDDLALSKSWLNPLGTVIGVAAWGVLISLAWWQRLKYPLIGFAIAWFLVGHSMESTIIPLEIIYEHRNYLPSLGLVILLVATCAHFAKLALPLLLVTSLVYFGLTWQRAQFWQSEESLFKSLATDHPESPISLYSYAELLNKQKNQPTEAYRYYLKAVKLNTDSASLKMQATLSAPMTAAVDPILNAKNLNGQLKQHHLTPFDLTVLDDASRCVLGKFARCVDHLKDVQQWLRAAIDNQGLDQNWRRGYVQSLFNIEMQFGLPQDALQTVTKAQQQDPQVFQYYLMKADALRATGQRDAALALINTAEKLAQQYNPALLESVYRLKNQVLQQP